MFIIAYGLEKIAPRADRIWGLASLIVLPLVESTVDRVKNSSHA